MELPGAPQTVSVEWAGEAPGELEAVDRVPAPWVATGVTLSKTGAKHHLVTTQNHHLIDQNGTKVEEETEFEGNGKPKKPEVRESTFFYLDGTEVSTLVKIDGQPLGA